MKNSLKFVKNIFLYNLLIWHLSEFNLQINVNQQNTLKT